MRHVIHVHQQKMRKGEPAIIDRTYIRSTHHTRLDIICPCGCDMVAATVIQSVEQDACGAHIIIEAETTRGDGPNAETPILRLGADVHYTKRVRGRGPGHFVSCTRCSRSDRLHGAGVDDGVNPEQAAEFFRSKGWKLRPIFCPEHADEGGHAHPVDTAAANKAVLANSQDALAFFRSDGVAT